MKSTKLIRPRTIPSMLLLPIRNKSRKNLAPATKKLDVANNKETELTVKNSTKKKAPGLQEMRTQRALLRSEDDEHRLAQRRAPRRELRRRSHQTVMNSGLAPPTAMELQRIAAR